MTCFSRTGFAVRWLATLAFFAGPLCLAAQAAPPQPPPAPTGTIYYRHGNTYYAVKPDGSGQAADILPTHANIANFAPPAGPIVNPAFSPSGVNATHDRWWLILGQTGVYDRWEHVDGSVGENVPHWDLFAVRSNPQDRSQLSTVQLTDLYGIALIHGGPCWSNDGNNVQSSFVTSVVRDLRDEFVEEPDGTTVIQEAQGHTHYIRFPLAISELESSYVPFGPDTWADETELDAMFYPIVVGVASFGNLNKQGTFAPNGDYYLRLDLVAQSATQLSIVEWTPTSTSDPWLVLWDGRNGVPTFISTPQWSPNSQTIAMENQGGLGDIWTQPASGAAVPKKVLSASVKGQKVTSYSNPVWSPDNKYLVVIKSERTGNTLTGMWLTRLSLNDGKTLDLAPVTDGTKLLRWTADN